MSVKMAEPIENEPITWNWSPHATKSKSNSDNTTNPNNNDEYSQQLSYNCYGQPLNKLMGGEVVGDVSYKRKRSNMNRNSGTDGVNNRSTRPGADDNSTKDANFWTKVLFGTNADSDPCQPNDLSAVSTSTGATKSNDKKSSSNTVIFNSIFSNLSNNNRSKAIQSMNDIDTINRNFHLSDASGAFNSKAKSLMQKRKCDEPNHRTNGHFDGNTVEDAASGSRMSLHNDLNSMNNTFLQALNDLHLDYNDPTNAIAENRETTATKSKSKDS